MHAAIKRHAFDHPHPRLLVSTLGLLEHPICSKLVELLLALISVLRIRA
jgi:hypothetical protein